MLEVRASCLDSVSEVLARAGFELGHVLVGSGGGPSRKWADRVTGTLEVSGSEVTRVSHLAGRLDQAARIAAVVIERGVTLLVAVGGGRVIDVVKLAASRTGTDFVSVPTMVSHDGISSPVASLQDRHGRRGSHAAAMPSGIVVDVDVVGTAPPRTLRAGVGDLVSNLTAILDWQLADRLGHDRYDAFSAMIAEGAARPVLNLRELTSESSHELLAKGLLLSGLAMAAAGTSRPCSGAEHLISHSLDAKLRQRAALHGEQVALGCLVSAAAYDSELLLELRRLFVQLGLPTHPFDVGISSEAFVEAVHEAPSTRPDRFTILSSVGARKGWAEELCRSAFTGAP